jgi:transcriptional regulator GlxA family with amidase domain
VPVEKWASAAIGRYPSRIFAELRLLKAKSLLEEGKLKVQEVTQEVGYLSPDSFSNAIAERFGFRPNAFNKWQHCNQTNLLIATKPAQL